MSFERKLARHGLKEVPPADERKPKERVLLAVPCVDDSIHPGVVHLMLTLERLGKREDIPWAFEFYIVPGVRPVEYARNKIVRQFLDCGADRLLMIDADMIPDPRIVGMLAVDADIVAPRMYALKREGDNGPPRLDLCAFRYNVLGDYRFNAMIPNGHPGPIEVDSVGTGCIAIKRHVLEDPRMRLPTEYEWCGQQLDLDSEDDKSRPEWAPAIFRMQRRPSGEFLRGEDLDFCLRARGLGYRIVVVPGLICGHAKLVNLDDMVTIAEKSAREQIEAMKSEAPGGVTRAIANAPRG